MASPRQCETRLPEPPVYEGQSPVECMMTGKVGGVGTLKDVRVD